MLTITGIIISGLGVATQTVAQQKPEFIARDLPDMSSMHSATMNVNINPNTFRIINYDYFFKEVQWDKDKIEDFGFIKIENIIFERKPYGYPGYIYIPCNSPHFTNHSQFEIISKFIPNVAYGKTISITVDSNKLEII